MSQSKKIIAVALSAAVPVGAWAAGGITFSDLIYNLADEVLSPLVGVALTAALLVFFWGLIKYLATKAGDSAKAGEGKTLMTWGVIALFVMVSVWGLVYLLQDTLGLNYLRAPAPLVLPGN